MVYCKTPHSNGTSTTALARTAALGLADNNTGELAAIGMALAHFTCVTACPPACLPAAAAEEFEGGDAAGHSHDGGSRSVQHPRHSHDGGSRSVQHPGHSHDGGSRSALLVWQSALKK
jgi:hypothetical protein